MSATTTVKCDGCGKKLDPRYATNYMEPQSKMRITRKVYQFDNGYDDIDQHYDMCVDCMRAFYEWFEKWQETHTKAKKSAKGAK